MPFRRYAAAVVALVALAACGDDDATDTADSSGSTVAPTVAASTDLPASTVAPVTTSEPTDPPSTDPPPTDPPPTDAVPDSLRPTPTQPTTSGPGGPAPSIPGGPTSGTNLERAIADLAARQEADPGDITVVSEENVTWPDSSLGCPEPGMGYTQVLTDGVRIVLELDGVQYPYHGGGSRGIFLCTSPTAPVG